MKHLHYLRIAVLAFGFPLVAGAQDFVNGSFEQNGNLCLLNTTPAVFNANVKNTRSFGSFRKPDIISNDCNFGSAKEGNWFVGLATNIQGAIRYEAITMQLNSEVQQGAQYTLTFWARSRSYASNLELGVSANDSTTGKTFYTVAASSITAEWTEISVRFTAPQNGKYISIKAQNANTNSGVWLDAFHLAPVFQADNVVMASKTEPAKTSSAKVAGANTIGLYPNPSEGIFKVNADSSALLSLTVYNMLGATVEHHVATPEEPVPTQIDLTSQQPGLYFVELATIDGEKTTKRIIVSR